MNATSKWQRLIFAIVIFVGLSVVGTAVATPVLTVTPASWDMVGLDSNRPVSTGPNVFPVGVRICNTSAVSPAVNVQTAYTWDTTNTLINLEGGSTISVGDLAPSTCVTPYYNVVITRGATNTGRNPAFNTFRRYRITVSADGVASISTPTPRQIYVQKLVSQNRNSTVAIRGACGGATSLSDPTTCGPAPGSTQLGAPKAIVGQTYTYTLFARTAAAYPQISAFINFPTTNFRIVNVKSEYSRPSATPASSAPMLYGDACGWQPNPEGAGYNGSPGPCIGPVNYPGGDVGGDVKVTYSVQILAGTAGGAVALNTLINDFSGSSYHYNSNFLTTLFTVTASWPVTTTVTGNGSVSANNGTIANCISGGTANCTGGYAPGSTVTLTASLSGGSSFTGWTGDTTSCTQAVGPPATITCPVDRARTINAAFTGGVAPVIYPLNATVTGSGAVSANSGAVSGCTASDGTCSGSYLDGTTVTLTATPDSGGSFTEWGGACSGVSTCTVTMIEAQNVTAIFAVVEYPLTVTVSGTGSVNANIGSISGCTDTAGICSGNYNDGTTVTLTATPGSGQVFTGWGGACSGTALTCAVTITQVRAVTATFVPGYVLRVTVGGGGSVSSDIGDVYACTASSGVCTDNYASGDVVVLTATPDVGAVFTGWTGDTTGCTPAVGPPATLSCPMGQNRNVTASFVNQYDLNVSVTGTGSVSGTPGGVSACTPLTGVCFGTFNDGAVVVLTATPGGGQVFTGWGGACASAGAASTCTVTMTEARNVTAIFAASPPATPAAAGAVFEKAGTLVFTSTLNKRHFVGGSRGTLRLTVRALQGPSNPTVVRMPVPDGFTVCRPLAKGVTVKNRVLTWSPVPGLGTNTSTSVTVCLQALRTTRTKAVVFKPALRMPNGTMQIRRNPALVTPARGTGTTPPVTG